MSTDWDQVHKRGNRMIAPGKPSPALAQFQKPLLAYLAAGLESDDEQVQVLAASLLGMLGDPAAAVFLRPLAAGPDAGPRAAAVAALGQLAVYPRSPVTGPKSPPCGNCMIRLIAEESLARRAR